MKFASVCAAARSNLVVVRVVGPHSARCLESAAEVN